MVRYVIQAIKAFYAAKAQQTWVCPVVSEHGGLCRDEKGPAARMDQEQREELLTMLG